jgi:hypothetical protein
MQARQPVEVRTHDAAWLEAQFPVTCSSPAVSSANGTANPRAAPLPTKMAIESGSSENRVVVPRVGSLSLTQQVSNYTADDSFYDNYHVMADLQRRWEDMALRSDQVHLEVIGKSWEGQNITMIRIGRADSNSPTRGRSESL